MRGDVTVISGRHKWTRSLQGGRIRFTLPTFGAPGSRKVTVKYAGDSLAGSLTRTIFIRVVK